MDELEHLFTWYGSGGGNCPAVYSDNDGNIVVQGWSDVDLDQLQNRADNESAVRIPYGLAEQIADMVNARRA